jgi:hypothetical protein
MRKRVGLRRQLSVNRCPTTTQLKAQEEEAARPVNCRPICATEQQHVTFICNVLADGRGWRERGG